jgi:hypothetical protein
MVCTTVSCEFMYCKIGTVNPSHASILFLTWVIIRLLRNSVYSVNVVGKSFTPMKYRVVNVYSSFLALCMYMTLWNNRSG